MFKKILPAIVLIIGFSTLPLLVSAQTTSAVAQPAQNGSVSCPTLYRDLDLGMRGDDVIQLQQFLRSQGYFTYPTNTGYYYTTTAKAVRAFQTAQGIVSTGTARSTGFGVVGPKTRAAIAALCGTVGYATPVSSTASTVAPTIAPASAQPRSATFSSACVSNSSPMQDLPIDFRIREGSLDPRPTATQPHSEIIAWKPNQGGTLFAEGLYSDGTWKPLDSGVSYVMYTLQTNPANHKVFSYKMIGSGLAIQYVSEAAKFAQAWNGTTMARFAMPVAVFGSPVEGTTLLWVNASLRATNPSDPTGQPCSLTKTYTIRVSSAPTTPTPTPATVTIVQPSSGASLTAGADNTVQWSLRNATVGDTATIRVSNGTQNYSTTRTIRSSEVNSNVLASLSIPSNAPLGSYTLSVTLSGGVSAQVPVQVRALVAPVTVVSPNGGESWQTGSTQTIRWSGGLPDSKVSLQITGADNAVIVPTTANTGSYSWTVPTGKAPGQYKVLVTCLEACDEAGSRWDTSNATFSVVAPTPTQPVYSVPTITIIQPTAGATFTVGGQYNNSVGWEHKNATVGDTITARVSNGQQTYSTAHVVRNSSSRIYVPIPMPADALPGNYTITVSSSGGASAQMPVLVQGSEARITVVSPNGGETYQAGSTQTIRWSGGTSNSKISLYVSKEAGADYTYIASVPKNTGSYDWTIPAGKAPGQYQVWVFCLEACSNTSTGSMYDTSDRTFSVTASTQSASVWNAFTNASQNTSSPSSGFSYEWTRDLQIGSEYLADVVALQTALRNEGVYAGDVTGGFYAQTFAGVKAFQQKYGIEATGYVGSVTRAKLNQLY